MNHKLLFCEGCDNIVSVLKNRKKIFICPLCGTINKRYREKILEGYIKILSPNTKCVINSCSSNDIHFNKLSEEEQDAINFLNYNGWRIIFVKGDQNSTEPPIDEKRKL